MDRPEGVGSFYDTYRALMEIRDKKHYHNVLGFETFEEYCKARWDMGRNYVNKLIASSVVVENLGTIVPIESVTESQLRPLTKIKDPDQQREAWQKDHRVEKRTPKKGKLGTEWGQNHPVKEGGTNLELANHPFLFSNPSAIRTRGTRIMYPPREEADLQEADLHLTKAPIRIMKDS